MLLFKGYILLYLHKQYIRVTTFIIILHHKNNRSSGLQTLHETTSPLKYNCDN